MDRNVADGAASAGAGVLGQGAPTMASRPAPYGRACVNCVRAKCKCILRNGGEICERYFSFIFTICVYTEGFRCFRLKKECRPSSSVRKKRATPRHSSQTARLEQKLDGLVSLLKANSQGTLSTEAIEASASSISANTLPSASIGGTDNATPGPSPQSPSKYGHGCENPAACLVPPPRAPYQENLGTQNRSAPITPASSSSSSFAYPLPRDVEPTPDEAELWFHTFQTKYMEHVPFAIPYIQNTSSTQLRQDKPVLWLGIMAVACPFVPKQLNLGRVFKELIAREIVVNGDRSTDLLLAMLTFGHWYVSLYPQCVLILIFQGILLPSTRPYTHHSDSPLCLHLGGFGIGQALSERIQQASG